MKYLLAKLVFVLALALGGFSANAATYYISDCQAGAVAGCVAGSDSNAGTNAAAPWKTTARISSVFSGLAAGDTIRFAKGGVWTNSQMWGLRNLNSRIANPITFDSYAPTWYSGTKKPLLIDVRPDITMFAFTGNPVVANEGYVVRNLELRGVPTPSGSNGFFVNRGARGLIVENVTTKDFAIGFYCGDDSSDNVVRNSIITHSRFSGLFGGCNNWLIENNTLDHNGYTSQPDAIPNRNHAIYIGKEPTTQSGVTIRGNTITNSVQFEGVCQGVPIVGHGQMNSIVIEDNLIDETPNVGPNKGGCWGISISPAWFGVVEKLDKIIIRRNRVINVGGIGIEVGGCNNCIVENNDIVKNDGETTAFIGIQAPGINPNPRDTAVDAPMGTLIIRNNSIYFSNPDQRWGSAGIQVSRGSKHVLVSNLIHFAVASNNGNTCFTGDSSFPALPLSSFTAYDNNLCYRAGNHGRYSLAYATLANAQAAGFDVHGSAANPQLAVVPAAGNKYSLALLAASPAIGAAHATRSTAGDIDKATRSAPPDIGAFEFTGTPAVPGAPRLVTAAAIPATTSVTVKFSPPVKDGRRPITGYTVTSSPAGGVDSNAGSNSLSHTMTGLAHGTSYTFTVKATNIMGTGAASRPSNGVKIK